jgi:hypothetical protein
VFRTQQPTVSGQVEVTCSPATDGSIATHTYDLASSKEDIAVPCAAASRHRTDSVHVYDDPFEVCACACACGVHVCVCVCVCVCVHVHVVEAEEGGCPLSFIVLASPIPSTMTAFSSRTSSVGVCERVRACFSTFPHCLLTYAVVMHRSDIVGIK